jgi:1-acyl-sn-glycerol-3-phosphate acyltransferase
VFVAKREVASWPLVGLVARVRGTVFVDRERRQQAANATAEIARFLGENQSIVLFAEGATLDRTGRRHFAARRSRPTRPSGQLAKSNSIRCRRAGRTCRR